jgi:glycosidase
MFGSKRANPEGDSAGHEDRWYRQPMKWSKEFDASGENCKYLIGFNDYTMTWDALNAQLDGVNEQAADGNSIYNLYKALIKIRKENSALARGKVVSHTTKSNVVCYSVKDATSEILVYVNACATEQPANYPLPTGSKLLYGSGVTDVKVPAMSIQIYKVK